MRLYSGRQWLGLTTEDDKPDNLDSHTASLTLEVSSATIPDDDRSQTPREAALSAKQAFHQRVVDLQNGLHQAIKLALNGIISRPNRDAVHVGVACNAFTHIEATQEQKEAEFKVSYQDPRLRSRADARRPSQPIRQIDVNIVPLKSLNMRVFMESYGSTGCILATAVRELSCPLVLHNTHLELRYSPYSESPELNLVLTSDPREVCHWLDLE